MNSSIVAVAATPLVLWVLYRARLRWALSAAKHRSLAGHARWSRRIARLLPFYEYSAGRFFAADEAPEAVVDRRRAGFRQLAEVFTARFARSAALTGEMAQSVSDLQFTARYRVPFQFSRTVREHLKGGSFLQASRRHPTHRPGWQPLLRSGRLLRRQCVRLRFLQGVHGTRRRAGA